MKRVYGLAVLLLFLLSASAQQLHILHTSDMHSRIEPISPQAADTYAGMGGMVRRATFVKQYRDRHPEMLLLDCGDISQGTPYYNFFQGELEVKMMNLMGYDVMAIGNHEFDFGLDNMARLFRMATFPVVCSNYDVAGTVLEGLVKRYVVLERNGVKIGIFGLSPKMEGLVQATKCKGVVYNDPVAVAREMADLLKGREGCDVVICLSHLGFSSSKPDSPSDENLIAGTRNIDLVLGGHSHTFMEKPTACPNADGRETFLLHSGKNGIYVGEAILTFTKK